jgi:hypothetical protein
LSPHQRKEHRQKIGVRASAILGQFWQDADTPEAVQVLEIEGWPDVLQNCSHSEIRVAWAEYQKSGPRTQAGKLYKPDAGALYHIVLKARPKLRLVKPEPPPDRVEPDEESKKRVQEMTDSFISKKRIGTSQE